jgi:hypothetical protein
VSLAIGSSLSFGQFLDGLEFTGQVQPFAKLRVRTHSVIPYLKAPLISACPPGDRRGFAARVINSIVQHLGKRVAHDLSGGTVFCQIQVLSYATPHHVLGKAKQREFQGSGVFPT